MTTEAVTVTVPDPFAAGLLAAQAEARPWLARLPWKIRGHLARASLDDLGTVRTEFRPGGSVLVISPAPDALEFMNGLHDAGWRRQGWEHEYGDCECGPWSLKAWLDQDGSRLEVTGTTEVPPALGRDRQWYFAPAQPTFPRRCTQKAMDRWKAEYEAWERKCRDGEW